MVLIIEDDKFWATSANPKSGFGSDPAEDIETADEGLSPDDPGDAQRASKTEPDGDGEEELR